MSEWLGDKFSICKVVRGSFLVPEFNYVDKLSCFTIVPSGKFWHSILKLFMPVSFQILPNYHSTLSELI
jgi:hypothetical protein